jgi:hypothetical protein
MKSLSVFGGAKRSAGLSLFAEMRGCTLQSCVKEWWCATQRNGDLQAFKKNSTGADHRSLETKEPAIDAANGDNRRKQRIQRHIHVHVERMAEVGIGSGGSASSFSAEKLGDFWDLLLFAFMAFSTDT